MSQPFEPGYSSEITITITSANSLGNNSYAGSAAVDNTSGEYQDALVSVTIATGASGTASTGTVVIYAYSDVDGTPHYSDGMTGIDATQTPTPNLKQIGLVNCVANGTTYRGGRFSVAKAFGGWMPKKWGIVLLNSSGGTIASSGNSASFVGVNDQVP